MKQRLQRAARATGRSLYILAVPKTVRHSTDEVRQVEMSPALGLVLRLSALLVLAGTVLAVHAVGHPLLGLARDALLLVGAVVILALSGALAPQGRLLGRLVLSYAKREAGRRGLTWRGRLFRALARRLEPAMSEKKEKGKTNDCQTKSRPG
jgi:hypothetical protein